MNTTQTLLMSVAASVAMGAAIAADPHLGRNLAATCMNCHGTNGVSKDSNQESLAGKDAQKTIATLNEFKTGLKPAAIMHQISKGYTDEQIALIAKYFEAQK